VTFKHNGLVAALSASDQRILRSSCDLIPLRANSELATSGKSGAAYFLIGTSVALLRDAGASTCIAVGLIGQEGAIGLQFGLGMGPSQYTMLVQTDGDAWRVSGHALRRLLQTRPSMMIAVARYLWMSTEKIGAFAADSQQPILKRLASWILGSHGGSASGSLQLTHVHMARMLGVQRASVSLAAKELQSRGLIDYARGSIRIVDRRGLIEMSQIGA
jgi:CRP-like cAMP-binding protein